MGEVKESKASCRVGILLSAFFRNLSGWFKKEIRWKICF